MPREFLFAVPFLLVHYCYALANAKPFLRRIRSSIAPFSLPFYEDGLDFSCTGCGKCCKVDGDVWLAPEEVDNVMNHLGYSDSNASSRDDFRKAYVRAEVAPSDGDQSQSWMCLKREEGACVFLDPLGKCSIYDVRPVQCSTYPFWPSLLKNQEAWDDESVLPDDITIGEGTDDRHWSPDLGGCEGIAAGRTIDSKNQLEYGNAKGAGLDDALEDGPEVSSIVEREEIVLKMKAAKKHWKRFPVQEIKESTWYL
mmetsp:Transcript_26165/g.45547  ORF Transcript_26165/g.45547 Transcript_26165/m.45547 type:complete len:254 (+) Transcript_26165:108-869(+)|eukprot:CAMPEP_0201907430 /NCGR_PEP_ID=MMETSP0902-20130614/57529_1 /ASSEMBLY_ACC=CAM_ASM_000551 /TAXON_ID=420261 /ORGANISM="Thalassiosira antarctica, Strain CCMP982" /LENGTH=253 /DNA_ID=CAMNT_0048441583 /DNA_START=59 /DNA_END=820 /DNA_ORIENTATION=-